MAEIYAAGDASDSSPSSDEEYTPKSTSQTRKPPLIALAMLRRAIGTEIASLDVNELSRRVYAGVLLKDDRKEGQEDQQQPFTHKYWVDEVLNKNCLMVLAKGLQIRGSDDSLYWKWTEEEEPSCLGNIKLPVAEQVDGCRLDIKGKCKTIMLSPRTTYQVTIMVKRSQQSRGFDVPVKLSLALPNGENSVREERLGNLGAENWIRISIGKFETKPETVGEITFTVTRVDKTPMSGLSVKGIVFMPTTK